MADITTISAALGSLKTAHELAKIIKTGSESFEKAEVKFQLAELISALADAKMELADIRSLMIEKDELIKDLRIQLNQKESLVFDAPYYWLQSDGKKDGPFCQRCKDVDNLHVRLQNTRAKGYWTCQNCNKDVVDSTYVPLKRKRASSLDIA